jgi:quercetin dioxygenase-like cupin family protein
VNESAGQGEQGSASEGIVLGPGEGRTMPGTDAMTLKATSEQTGGSIGFLEATSSPGYGPPRHIHHSHDELFYVLEGGCLFLVGERQVGALPGTFFFIPRGTVQAAKVTGTEPGRCS